jgi:hypothetical protein
MAIDQERQKQAKEYAHINHRMLAVDLILSTVAIGIVLVSGLSVWLRDFVLSITPNFYVGVVLYFVIGVIG